MYFIFKRNDGYVGCVSADDRKVAEVACADFGKYSFTITHEFTKWNREAITELARQRAASPHAMHARHADKFIETGRLRAYREAVLREHEVGEIDEADET